MKNNFSVLSAIGNTPIVKIKNIYAKLEFVNPSGSINCFAGSGGEVFEHGFV